MLSIIVPVYNIKLYLEECVNSLLNQYYKNCEIILVDDGSTDGSGEICDTFALKDPRIKVIHQENGGLPAARNAGLNISQGKYIAFVDSDDLVNPSIYSELITVLEENNADVAICNCEVFNMNNSYKGNRYKDEVIEYTPTNQVSFFGAALDSGCNRVFLAAPIKSLNLQFEHKSIVAQEDYWFQVRLFTHITRIVTTSAAHYKYRERGSSITKSKSDGDITKRCLDFLHMSENYISTYSDRICDEFLSYVCLDMFRASINNVPEINVLALKSVIKNFSKIKFFKRAISKSFLGTYLYGHGLRRKYTLLCFCLIRHNFVLTFSMLESIRLRMLRSNSRKKLYFD